MECLNVVTSNRFSKYNELCTKNPKKSFLGFAAPVFFCHHQATRFHPKKNIALDSHNQQTM
jgi:hypothetical protein